MMTDPIADMLTRIRNALTAKKENVSMPYSKIKEAVISTIIDEGYLEGYQISGDGHKKEIIVILKYINQQSVIREITRISKPGGRIYVGSENIPMVMSGYGISILSTSKGIMSDRSARQQHIGGEVLCKVL